MTANELRAWLDQQPFHPFQVKMDNGDVFTVQHPELAFISSHGALYVFEPSQSEIADVAGPQTICEIRNISTIQPLPEQTA